MAASIRGEKAHVRILENGQIVDWFELTGFDFQEDSQNTESYYLGRKKPETDKLQMGWSGSLTGEVKSAVVDELIQRINDAVNAGVQPPAISLVLIEEYPDTASDSTHVFTDVQLIYSNRRQAGVNEKISKTLTFRAADKRIS